MVSRKKLFSLLFFQGKIFVQKGQCSVPKEDFKIQYLIENDLGTQQHNTVALIWNLFEWIHLSFHLLFIFYLIIY